MSVPLLLTSLLLILLAIPPVAAASDADDRHVAWATVNACAPEARPDALGVRANVPGDGSDAEMYVRITGEWYSEVRQSWLPVDGHSVSPWIDAGSASYAYRQVGWTFQIETPPGTTRRLRGVAEIEWRVGKRVMRSESRATRGGLRGVDEGDPPGTSLATCSLSGARTDADR